MKISIITVCFNSSATIRDTLTSVQMQKNADYEHLIIDGGSKDNTLSIVAEFQRPELRVFSGPDKGIYDAMNKGVMQAKGDIIGFLNSDDFFASDDVIADIQRAFQESTCDVLYGDIFYVDPVDTSKVSRVWQSKSFNQARMKWGWHPPHPGFYVREELFRKVGAFNLNYPIAADYDFMIRCLRHENVTVSYLSKVLVRMRSGGNSNQSIKNILLANRECYESARKAGFRFPRVLVFSKMAQKILQFPVFQPQS